MAGRSTGCAHSLVVLADCWVMHAQREAIQPGAVQLLQSVVITGVLIGVDRCPARIERTPCGISARPALSVHVWMKPARPGR